MDKKILDALMDNIFPPEEATRYFKGLLYGPPGSGKTTLACTIGNKLLFLVADPEGWQSLENHPKLGLNTGRITLMTYRGVSQLEALATAWDEGIEYFMQFDTLIIDTATNIASLDLDLVAKQKVKATENLSKDKQFDFDRDMRGVYNQNAMRIKTAFLKLFLQPINIVATAHDRQKEHPRTGVVETFPKFSPEILASVNGMCSMIAYMTANEAGIDDDGSQKYTRRIQYHPTRSILAKTRIGGLPPTQNNPNLREIVEKWQAKGGVLLPENDAVNTVPENEGIDGEIPAAKEDETLTDFGLGD